MARRLRVEYPSAIYHVMNPGDRREPISKDDGGRQRFVETLGEVCAKTGWQMLSTVAHRAGSLLDADRGAAGDGDGANWIFCGSTVLGSRSMQVFMLFALRSFMVVCGAGPTTWAAAPLTRRNPRSLRTADIAFAHCESHTC